MQKRAPGSAGGAGGREAEARGPSKARRSQPESSRPGASLRPALVSSFTTNAAAKKHAHCPSINGGCRVVLATVTGCYTFAASQGRFRCGAGFGAERVEFTGRQPSSRLPHGNGPVRGGNARGAGFPGSKRPVCPGSRDRRGYAWRWGAWCSRWRSLPATPKSAGWALSRMVSGLLLKWFVVLGALYLAMAKLHLPPLPMIVASGRDHGGVVSNPEFQSLIGVE